MRIWREPFNSQVPESGPPARLRAATAGSPPLSGTGRHLPPLGPGSPPPAPTAAAPGTPRTPGAPARSAPPPAPGRVARTPARPPAPAPRLVAQPGSLRQELRRLLFGEH